MPRPIFFCPELCQIELNYNGGHLGYMESQNCSNCIIQISKMTS